MTTPALPMSPALAGRLAGDPLVLLLDIDGTLSPIAPRPQDAAIAPATRETLAALARLSDVHVVAISGRAAQDAARLVGLDSVWIVGNHGIEIAAPGATPEIHADIARFAEQLSEASTDARAVVEETPGAILEDKRWTLSVHQRLVARDAIAALDARIADIANKHRLALTHGKEVLELRPTVKIDKGTAALELAVRLGALAGGASLLSGGDDRTDEDMFRALRSRESRWVTVHVDGGSVYSTAAEFSVPDPEAMRALLRMVLEQRVARARTVAR
ncbi:MAG: trehalose-phosphatase [Gemmatimonadales bacterium]